jgi:hypothetical protein
MEVLHLVVDYNTSYNIWTMLETTFASPSRFFLSNNRKF